MARRLFLYLYDFIESSWTFRDKLWKEAIEADVTWTFLAYTDSVRKPSVFCKIFQGRAQNKKRRGLNDCESNRVDKASLWKLAMSYYEISRDLERLQQFYYVQVIALFDSTWKRLKALVWTEFKSAFLISIFELFSVDVGNAAKTVKRTLSSWYVS